MEEDTKKVEEREKYESPKVLASYTKKELEEAIQPHGGGGCGCGSGILI